MLLIAENEVTNLDAYLKYFVPVAAKTIHTAGGQYVAAGEAKSLSGQPLTRVIIVRFESMDRLQQWWRSAERQQAWKIGAKYARFRDIAVAADMPPVRLPLAVKKGEKGDKRWKVRLPFPMQTKERPQKMHLFSYAETSSFFLERERKAPDAAQLRKFGLSKRESEVLAWVAQGKTNGEIAAILSLNLGTVKKHLEHIFEKLGVETRIAAAILALDEAQLSGG